MVTFATVARLPFIEKAAPCQMVSVAWPPFPRRSHRNFRRVRRILKTPQPAPCPYKKEIRGQPKQRNEQHPLIPSIQMEQQAVARGLEWSWDSVLSGVAVGPGLRGSDYHSLRGAVLDTRKARVTAGS
jgi:hypothetical protein